MAKAVYVTGTDDVLDAITYQHYNGQAGAFESVLAANPGLAAYGSIFPAGLEIELPDLAQPEDPNIYSLW